MPELATVAETEPTEDLVSVAGRKALSALASLMFEAPDENVEDDDTRRSLQAIAMGTGPLNQARLERSQIVLHLSQAVDLQARNQFESAAMELENAINAGLDNPSAYFDLGMLRVKVGKLESGTRNLQQAVGHPDYSIAARLLLGQTFSELGRLRESAIQYLHALKLADSMVVDKDQAEELKQLYEPVIESQSQEANEDVHKALSNSIENLLMRPDWRAQLIKARNQISGPSRDAPPTPIAELLTQTQSGQVVEMLANAHQMARNGYYRMAMEEAFRAVRYAPTYLPLHTFMGEILLQQDNVQEAITKFNVVARAYSARGEAARAIELLRKITRLAPLDLVTRQRLIEQLTAFGQIEETITEYLDLGDVYYRLAELEKARNAYKKALNVAQQSGLSQWTIEILHHLADIDLQRLDWRPVGARDGSTGGIG
jgi:tetratricopeptide (TPR) repeat protein